MIQWLVSRVLTACNRKDWANAGRNAVSKPMGTKTSPLLLAAKAGSIESVEWFLTEAPLRQYIEFSKSKVASEDSRLKHLNQTTGGFEKIIRKWLSSQSMYSSATLISFY